MFASADLGHDLNEVNCNRLKSINCNHSQFQSRCTSGEASPEMPKVTNRFIGES